MQVRRESQQAQKRADPQLLAGYVTVIAVQSAAMRFSLSFSGQTPARAFSDRTVKPSSPKPFGASFQDRRVSSLPQVSILNTEATVRPPVLKREAVAVQRIFTRFPEEVPGTHGRAYEPKYQV